MKKLLKSFALLIILFTTLIYNSCNSNDDCEKTACTEEFRTILVSIKDQNQNPIALDSFEVINLQNGNKMTVSLSASGFEMAQQSGQYPLVNDLSLKTNQERQVQFKGFIDNQEVINSTYKVSTDCCHINLVSGNLNLSF